MVRIRRKKIAKNNILKAEYIGKINETLSLGKVAHTDIDSHSNQVTSAEKSNKENSAIDLAGRIDVKRSDIDGIKSVKSTKAKLGTTAEIEPKGKKKPFLERKIQVGIEGKSSTAPTEEGDVLVEKDHCFYRKNGLKLYVLPVPTDGYNHFHAIAVHVGKENYDGKILYNDFVKYCGNENMNFMEFKFNQIEFCESKDKHQNELQERVDRLIFPQASGDKQLDHKLLPFVEFYLEKNILLINGSSCKATKKRITYSLLNQIFIAQLGKEEKHFSALVTHNHPYARCIQKLLQQDNTLCFRLIMGFKEVGNLGFSYCHNSTCQVKMQV